MLLKRLLFGTLGVGTAFAVAGCDDPFQLQPAAVANEIDTVTVYALQGTDISLPSGYDVARRQPARTDRGDPFDFTFDINDGGVSRVYPQGALGLDVDAGVILSEDPFGRIEEAPADGYARDTAIVVRTESVFVVRSRGFGGSGFGIGDDCPFFIGALPRYGKFRVMSIDTVNRLIVLEALVNVNCGYRGLLVGLPRK